MFLEILTVLLDPAIFAEVLRSAALRQVYDMIGWYQDRDCILHERKKCRERERNTTWHAVKENNKIYRNLKDIPRGRFVLKEHLFLLWILVVEWKDKVVEF